MGRPNLTEVRTAEILDAFERCVGRFGLEGSSLELIAQEAGMKRSILRHYVGNREDLIHALAERVLGKYREQLNAFLESISPDKRVDLIISFFFPSKPTATAESILVVEALIAAGEQFPNIRVAMSGYVEELVTAIAGQLRQAYPHAAKSECWAVSYGVVSICFNQDSLISLNLTPKYLKAARSCARLLISSLEAK